MNPDRINELLRSLPRDGASEFFTPRVMAAVRARGARPRRLALRVATAVGVLALVVAVFAGDGWHQRQVRDADLAAVRTEQQHLERELEALKDLTTPSSQPVLYVGSTGEYDYFIDLQALQEESVASATPAVQRANYQPGI